jgi:hypothetical protein
VKVEPIDAASLRVIEQARAPKSPPLEPRFGWYDLSAWHEWVDAVVAVRNRDGSERQRKLSPEYERLGLMGELTVSLATGLELDASRTVGGDEEDFADTDVKACRHRHGVEPTLKHPVGAHRWHTFYVLVEVCLELELARIVGTCTRQHLAEGRVETFHEQSGPQHVRGASELTRGLPSHLTRAAA